MPQGRSKFTSGELDQIRRLVREKQVADRDRQKSIRARLRAMGFRIADFADRPGFVESVLDDLIARGAITVITDEPGDAATVSLPARRHVDVKPRTHAPTSVREGDGLAWVARDAMRALAKKARLHDAEPRVPARPGLYAIYGGAETWSELGLGDPPDERPLYVGKAEDSLVTRHVSTHFGNDRTGSSTVRRSFAALLGKPLRLSALPRTRIVRSASRTTGYHANTMSALRTGCEQGSNSPSGRSPWTACSHSFKSSECCLASFFRPSTSRT